MTKKKKASDDNDVSQSWIFVYKGILQWLCAGLEDVLTWMWYRGFAGFFGITVGLGVVMV